MSIKYTNLVKYVRCSSPCAKDVLRVLADFADENGFSFPSQESMACIIQRTTRYIKRGLKELYADKIVQKANRNHQRGYLIEVNNIPLKVNNVHPSPSSKGEYISPHIITTNNDQLTTIKEDTLSGIQESDENFSEEKPLSEDELPDWLKPDQPEEKPKPTPEASPKPKRKTSRRKPERPLPRDFTLTDKRRQVAIAKSLTPDFHFEGFRNWCQSKDQRYRDWEAAWRNWCASPIAQSKERQYQQSLRPATGMGKTPSQPTRRSSRDQALLNTSRWIRRRQGYVEKPNNEDVIDIPERLTSDPLAIEAA